MGKYADYSYMLDFCFIYLLSVDLVQNKYFQKILWRRLTHLKQFEYISGLIYCVDPELGPHCFLRLSVDYTSMQNDKT